MIPDLQTLASGGLSMQLRIRDYTTIILHPGNPPLIQYCEVGVPTLITEGFSQDSLE